MGVKVISFFFLSGKKMITKIYLRSFANEIIFVINSKSKLVANNTLKINQRNITKSQYKTKQFINIKIKTTIII